MKGERRSEVEKREGEQSGGRRLFGETSTEAGSKALTEGVGFDRLTVFDVGGFVIGGDALGFASTDASRATNIDADQARVAAAVADQALRALGVADDGFVATAAIKLAGDVDAISNGFAVAGAQLKAVFGEQTIGVLDIACAFFGIARIEAKSIPKEVLARLLARLGSDPPATIGAAGAGSKVGNGNVFGGSSCGVGLGERIVIFAFGAFGFGAIFGIEGAVDRTGGFAWVTTGTESNGGDHQRSREQDRTVPEGEKISHTCLAPYTFRKLACRGDRGKNANRGPW